MAVTATVTKKVNLGSVKLIHGTFTSASLDHTLSLPATVHGLNVIMAWGVALTEIGEQAPIITISSGTLTAIWQDTRGKSGTWFVIGR